MRIIVDFDGPLIQGPLRQSMPGAREALRELLAAGFKVDVYSCRTYFDGLKKTHGDARRNLQAMKMWLFMHQMPYSKIELGYHGKPPADWYVDDKAIHHDGTPEAWPRIVRQLLAGKMVSEKSPPPPHA